MGDRTFCALANNCRKRLADLDLSGNQLSEVKNLHHLPALVQLNLGR